MDVHIPLTASLTGGVLIMLQMALMMTVGFRRIKYNQGIGTGDHTDLELLIRRHGNLAENAAIFVVVLALLEMIGGTPMAVAILGAAYVSARIMHAIGLSMGDSPNAPRFLGASGTMMCGLGTGGYLVYQALLTM